jgi:hypothetical protein
MTQNETGQLHVDGKYQNILLQIQDVDHRNYNTQNPEVVAAANELFLLLADEIKNDDLADIRIKEIAKHAARVGVGATVAQKICKALFDDRKDEYRVGGSKADLRKVFASAKAAQDKKNGVNMSTGWEAEWFEMVNEMNKNHANVINGSKNFIVRFGISHITNGRTVEYIPPRELAGLHLHTEYTTGVNEDGKKTKHNKVDAWLRHTEHRRYEKGVYFLPVQPGANRQPLNDALNLWDGFAVEPKAGGKWDKIDYHIRHVLAGGDSTVYNYLLDWCAYTIQHPERQAGAAIVFRGKKRVGKGIFANWLVELWGNHGVMVNNGKHLTGQFNGHLEQTCLLFLDEALYAGDKKHESMLKSLITEPNLMIERKHHDAVTSANRLKIVMATNDDWSVPTSGDDARFCVCDVSDLHKGDDGYFSELRSQMATQEAKSAFLADMLERDISKFHSGHVPKTKALTDQIEHSLSPLWKWWMDCLESEHNNGSAWDDEVKSSDLYDAYVRWLDMMKVGQYERLTQTGFSREFNRAYPKKRRMDGIYWVIGQLIDARQAFRMEIIGERPEKEYDDDLEDGVPF